MTSTTTTYYESNMEPTLLISGVSALLTAIQTWIQYRDSERAAREFEARSEKARVDPAIQAQASLLATLVPAPVLETMTDRAQQCWGKYHDVLKGGYLPAEIDEATQSVKKCICRELRRIVDLNGSLPPGELSDWWNAYCV